MPNILLNVRFVGYLWNGFRNDLVKAKIVSKYDKSYHYVIFMRKFFLINKTEEFFDHTRQWFWKSERVDDIQREKESRQISRRDK